MFPNWDQWVKIFEAGGGFSGLNSTLAAAGGESLHGEEFEFYWTSTVKVPGSRSYFWYIDSNGNFTVDNYGANWDQKYRVRGCLVF